MNENNKKSKLNNNKDRGLFYGVIAVATFIIMAVGATFAYFTASTSSANSTVKTGSTKLELDYISYSEAWMNNKLIPVDMKVAEYSVEWQDDTTKNKMCVDDYGNQICSAYVFQVRNTANSPQDVSINLISENNGFANLHAMVYEISKGEGYSEDSSTGDPGFKLHESDSDDLIKIKNANGDELYLDSKPYGVTPIDVNRKGVKKTLLKYNDPQSPQTRKSSIGIPVKAALDGDGSDVSTRTSKLADGITINGVNSDDGSNLKTFMIVLYINNLNQNQNETDSMKDFVGKVEVSTGDGSTGVSGTISSMTGELESDKTTSTTTTTTTSADAETSTTTKE